LDRMVGLRPVQRCLEPSLVAGELLDLSLDAEESLVVPQRLAADLAAVVDPQFVELPPREAREVSRPTCPSALAPRGSAALP